MKHPLLTFAMNDAWSYLHSLVSDLSERTFWILSSHDMQHGAEIGCLRDLYRQRSELAG